MIVPPIDSVLAELRRTARRPRRWFESRSQSTDEHRYRALVGSILAELAEGQRRVSAELASQSERRSAIAATLGAALEHQAAQTGALAATVSRLDESLERQRTWINSEFARLRLLVEEQGKRAAKLEVSAATTHLKMSEMSARLESDDRALTLLEATTGRVEASVADAHSGLDALSARIEANDTALGVFEATVSRNISELAASLSTLDDKTHQKTDRIARELATAVAGAQSEIARVDAELVATAAQTRRDLQEATVALSGLDTRTAESTAMWQLRLTALAASLEANTSTLANLQSAVAHDVGAIAAELDMDASLLRELANSVFGPHDQVDRDDADAFYLELERRHRGSRELIAARLEQYRPQLTNWLQTFFNGTTGMQLADLHVMPGAQAPSAPISPVNETASVACLDIGCGRGEWLEFLQGLGLRNTLGIDLNAEMVACCVTEYHLPAVQADALEFLRLLPDRSIGLLTAFHIVEHLSPPTVRAIMREVGRVIHPGGLCIFETPNPENLLTGSQYFYLDPTHLHPLPPDLLILYCEHAGLSVTEILRMQPNPDLGYVRDSLPSGHTDTVVNLMLNHFRASRDYAVIATRP